MLSLYKSNKRSEVKYILLLTSDSLPSPNLQLAINKPSSVIEYFLS